MREYYSITELTREFDISTRTLRFYEDEGLIQPVRRGRTRLFRPSDRHLIRQIMRGKRLGFSINEIREIIQMYKEPPGEVGQLKLMIKRIEEKREDLRQKRRDLEETLAELDQAEEILRRAAGRTRRQYLKRRRSCRYTPRATANGDRSVRSSADPLGVVAVFLAEFRRQDLFLTLDGQLLTWRRRR